MFNTEPVGAVRNLYFGFFITFIAVVQRVNLKFFHIPLLAVNSYKTLISNFIMAKPHSGRQITKEFIEARIGFKRPSRERNFRQLKKRYGEGLREFLQLKSSIHTIYPPLKPVIIKINKLPFAFTFESSQPIFYNMKSERLSREQLGKAKRVSYLSPFVGVQVNGSNRSLEFWREVAELTQRYPHATIFPHFPSTYFEIIPSGGESSTTETLSKQNALKRVEEAKKFFNDLEKIVDNYIEPG